MEREERTRIGRSPLDTGRGDRPGMEREERTRIGRAPLDPGTTTSGGRPAAEGESPRTGGPRETKGGGIDFSQDELMPRESPRTERPREGKSAEVFESSPSTERPRTRGRTEEGGRGSDFESSRPSGERPQVPTRARDAADASSGEFDAPQELGTPAERPQVPARARDAADASSGEFDVPHDVDDPWASAERPQVPTRTRDAAEASSGGFDVPREPEEPRAPGGRPQGPGQPRSAEDAASGFEAPSDLGSPEAPPRGPGRGRGADGQSTGVFGAPRGEEGNRTVRGERLPSAGTLFESRPSTRPGGHPSLPASGPGSPAASTTGLPGARSEVASLEELLPDLSGILDQEALAEHFAENLLLLPPRQSPASRSLRLWAMFTAYAEANAKNPMGQTAAGRQAFAETLTANGFAALRDVRTGRDGVEVALELLDAPSLEEFHEQLGQVHMEPGPERLPTEVSLPVAEEHRTPEQPEARKEAAARQPQGQRVLDAKEKEADRSPVPAGQAGVQAASTQQPQALAPGMLAPRDPRQEWEEEKKERDRRGTNKRLGPNMLWSVLHELRASPEDSAVLKEKWSQLAFGAVVCLLGAALLVAMLASL
ncbi:hypothetical protein [Cystobacter ferrugineus]|uniref:Immediate early protein ICP0 n=1 Tax=Cystobacter ferrugineus TaxID=83449 RepID=A0A1L9BJ17_9BACT|nr:hypothetical protein [Cystobacter ferrugineus]OJH42229.1 hypothetical protein BON30_03185 [Cystobacter ferrugineus]